MKNLSQKVVVITGAGSGIGRSLAIGLAGENAQLALCDVNINSLKETQQILFNKQADCKVRIYPLDVSKKQEIHEFYRKCLHDFGFIDILINNAGVASFSKFIEMDDELFEWTLNVNMWGVVDMSKAFLPCLLTRPEASIVNISSVFGLLGVPYHTAYCTSKFAIRGFSEALRQEYYKSSLSVMLVYPCGIKTNIIKDSRIHVPGSEQEIQFARAKFETAFRSTPDEVSRKIIQGIKKKSARVLVGKNSRMLDWLARLKPSTYDRQVARFMRQLI